MIRWLQGPALALAEYRSSRGWTHTVMVQLPRAIRSLEKTGGGPGDRGELGARNVADLLSLVCTSSPTFFQTPTSAIPYFSMLG
jgi:hypothetical protein